MTMLAIKAAKKNLGSPDGVREFDNGQMESVTLDDMTCTRVRLQPGWKWSQDVRPLVGTDSCQCAHMQYVISGRLMVAMDDGSKLEIGPDDFAHIPPGHDAWVLDNEPFVALDFSPGMKEYAK
jgi:hypothetical protein